MLAYCHDHLFAANGFRRFKRLFPNIGQIIEGSVDIAEAENGEWEILKIESADPLHEAFLRQLAQGFVEYVESNLGWSENRVYFSFDSKGSVVDWR